MRLARRIQDRAPRYPQARPGERLFVLVRLPRGLLSMRAPRHNLVVSLFEFQQWDIRLSRLNVFTLNKPF